MWPQPSSAIRATADLMSLVALRQVGAGLPKMSISMSEPSFAPGIITCLHV
jgi:hypothetical protein